MLANKNQPIVAGLLSLSVAGIVGATALPFNDRIEYRIGNRIESQPAWLVPPKAEFRTIERGYGGIKILLALLATGGMVTVMLIARKEGKLEPTRQRIKSYQQRAYEFGFAAESAYQMSTLATRYKKLADADEVAIEGEIEAAYMQSLGIDPNAQQPLLTGTATLESISNPGDKVDPSASSPALKADSDIASPNLQIARQTAAKVLNSLAAVNTSIFLAGPTRTGKTRTLHKWLRDTKAQFPQADIYIIAQKYEDFPGVPRDRIMIFDPLRPEQSMKFLDEVYEKLQTRKSKPATEETYRNQPIKLIFEDWFATHQTLMQKKNAQLWENIATKMGSVATVGGQYNVGYFICTQTFNLTSSGVADSNIRLNLALIAQGLIRTKPNGEQQGSYGTIELMLNNHTVFPNKETRERLAADLQRLIPISMTEQTPIVLSTIGNPVLGLMPQIEVETSSANDVSDAQISTSDDSLGKGSTLPEQEAGNLSNPCGRAVAGSSDAETTSDSEALSQSLNGFLAEVLAENLPPIFADDFPLKKHDRRVQLAKLVIAKNLGKQKTIYLLWGVTDGGRNHQRYVDAREMLEKLSKGEDNTDAQ